MKTKVIKMKWIVTCLMLFFLSSCQTGQSGKKGNDASVPSNTTQTNQQNSSQATIYLSDNQKINLTAFNKISGSIDLKNSGILIPLDSNSNFSLSSNNDNDDDKNDDKKKNDNENDDKKKNDNDNDNADKNKNKKKIKIQVTSTCTIKNEGSSEEKITKELEIKKSNLNISFLEVMPDQALIQQRPISCRFAFKVLDSDQATRTYIVFSKSIDINSEKLNSIPLKQELGDKYYPISQDGLINETNFNLVELNLDGDFKDDLSLSCEDLDSNIFLKKTNSTKIFESLYPEPSTNKPSILENMQGTKNCRIISKSQSLITGLSSSFQMDFNSIKAILYEKYIDLKPLEYGWVLHKDYDSKTSFQPKSRSYEKNYTNDKFFFDEGSFIKINGLPRKFHENKYEDVTMIIESTCSLHKDDLENTRSQIYELPLQDKISVMSIVPEKFFQLYYKEEIVLESGRTFGGCDINSTGPQILIGYNTTQTVFDIQNYQNPYEFRKPNYRGTPSGTIFCHGLDNDSYDVPTPATPTTIVSDNQMVYCNYKIDFEKSDEAKRATGTESFEIEITGGSSYGISLDEINEENFYRSSYITEEHIVSGQAGHLNFLFKDQFSSYHNYQRDMKPDTIALKCGRQKDTENSEFLFEEKFLIYSKSDSLKLDSLFNKPTVEEYFGTSKEQTRCRVMFYKNNKKNNKKNLLYFSSELLIRIRK